MLNLRICLKYCNFKIRLFRNSSQSFTSSKVIKYIFFFVFSVTSKVVSIGGDFLEGRAIPLWILLLAVLAGLVFLALVSLILWHCGFFRRNRHDQQPMHNGSVIQANQVYLNEAANVHEKEPLAASNSRAATITRY